MAGEVGGAGPLLDIGAQLRARRLDLGLGLDEVQAVTRIALRHLEAMEEGRAADLPVSTYVRGYIRTYGNFLGLDGAALAALYGAREAQARGEEALAGAAPGRSRPDEGPAGGQADASAPFQRSAARRGTGPAASGTGVPSPWSGAPLAPRRTGRGSRRRRRGDATTSPAAESLWALALVVAVAIAVLAVLGPHGGRGPAATSAPAGAGAPASPPPASATPPSSTAPGGAGSAGKPPAGPGGNPPALVQVPGAPSRTVAYRVYGTAPLRLEADAVGRCWIGVKADGATVRQQTLTAGETATFQAQRTISVLEGNPPGLALVVNGKRIQPVASTHPLTFRFTLASGGAAAARSQAPAAAGGTAG